MKTLSVPEVGSQVRVVVRFTESLLSSPSTYRDTEYRGQVVVPNKWDSGSSFKLFTGNPAWPYSIIDIDRVVDIEYISGKAGKAVKSDVRTFTVNGSRGSKYTVTQNGTKWSCTCTGFQYHRKCKHIKEIQDAK